MVQIILLPQEPIFKRMLKPRLLRIAEHFAERNSVSRVEWQFGVMQSISLESKHNVDLSTFVCHRVEGP